jgi:hypothetical protein
MDYETIVKGMTKEAWKGTAFIFLVVAVLGVVAWLAPPGVLQTDYYQAYTLNDQYVGDITVGDTEYQDVLIMDVTYQEYAYGLERLHTSRDFWIFGDLNVYDWKYLGESDKTGKLYFAGEHETQDRLTTGRTIIAHWVEVTPGNYAIRGVFNYDEVDFE